MNAKWRNSFGTGNAGRQTCAPGRAMSSLAKVFVLFMSLIGLGLWGGNAMAATFTSVAAGGVWATAATWNGGAGPAPTGAATDVVVIAGPGAVTIGVTVTQAAGASVTINNGGSITATAAGTTVTFGALTIASGGTLTTSRILTVLGATNITGTINFSTTARVNVFTGDVTLNSGAVWNETINNTPTFSGNFTNNATTFTASTGTYTFNGAGKILSGATTTAIPSVTFTTGAGPINNGTLTVATLLTVTGVTLTNNGTITATASLAGTGGVTQGTTGTLNIGGTSTITTLTASAAGNTVNYTGAAQTVKATAYYNLMLSGNGAKTMTSVTAIGGNLSISGTATMTGNAAFTVTGALNYSSTGSTTLTAATAISIGSYNQTAGTLVDNGNTINVTGTGANTWTKTGTFTATGTVNFTGAAPQIGTANFNNLTITVGVGNTATLTGNVTATTAAAGVVTLTSGTITTGINTLIIPRSCATPSVTRTNGWVNGNLQKAIPAGVSTCNFEVGGTSAYTPITATFIAGALASNITAKSTDGDHPNIATSGLDPSLTANRFWSLTSTAAEATAFSAVFNFVAGDLDADTQPLTLFNGRQYSSAAWTTPTTGTRAATSTQLTGLTLAAVTQKDFVVGEVAQSGGTGAGGFNVVENGASATTGKIYTKLAGTAFTLDMVALNVAHTAIDTTFKGVVKVELLNSSNNSGGLDANGCRPTWAVIQTLGTNPQFLAADSGRKQNVSFTENNAWPDARVRVSYPATGTATLIGCSTDNFSIRPASITSVTSNMTNTATSGTPSAIAGSGTFNLIAATGLTGYTGTPKIDNTAVQAHASAKQNGSVSGSFPAAVAGTSTGTSVFTYSEVGNFKFLGSAATPRGVYDDTFTAVDGASDCTADFSNVLVGGKYGCKFGITADTSFFGRFYPANFVLTPGTFTNRRIAACAPASTFTYAGEEFRVTFTLTAKNGAGVPVTTQNYDPAAGFASFNANTIANLSFGAVDLADATLTASLTPGTSSGTWASGSVPVTADLMLSRAASPNGPFESFNLGTDPIDADGVKLNSYNLDTTVPPDTSDHGLVGTSKIRFGRLKLSNAHGSELLNLPIPVQAQYWNGATFMTNAADNCTTLTTSNIKLTPLIAGVSAPPTVVFSSGVGSLTLTKPTTPAKVAVDLCVDLGADPGVGTVCLATSAVMPYLQGLWAPGSNYNNDPTARATFGVYKGANEFIYLRENY